MFYVTGTRRKLEIAPDRFTGEQHAKKRQPKDHSKRNEDDTSSPHVSRYYIRSSSSSITSAQVETVGKVDSGTPRLAATSCRRP